MQDIYGKVIQIQGSFTEQQDKHYAKFMMKFFLLVKSGTPQSEYVWVQCIDAVVSSYKVE